MFFFSIYCLPVCEVSSCADSSIPPSLLRISRLFKRLHWQSRWYSTLSSRERAACE